MRHVIIVAALVAAGCGGVSQAETERLELANGMDVILQPIEQASHVALAVVFDIGNDHDPPGESGLAHMVEHVYVTAAAGTTKARTTREYMAAYPQGWNAQTGDRYTVVATVFDPGALEAELNDAADRMHSLRVTTEDLDREKPRIVQELHNMYDGMPQLAAMNRARETIRPSAAGHRKGGVVDHVSKLSPDAVQEWWQRYYKPNNATLVLAGRFEPGEAKEVIERRFSQLEPGEPPPPVQEPARDVEAAGGKPLAEPVHVKIEPNQRSAQTQVCLAYRAPAPTDDAFAAFLVLVAKLQARADELKAGPQTFPVRFMALDDPDVLYVTLEVSEAEKPQDTIARLDAFIRSTVREPIAKRDLEFARQSFAFLYGLSDLPEAALANNVYGVAFGLARRKQLGIDSGRLANAIADLQQDSIDRCRDEVFNIDRRAAIVASPE